MEKKRQSHTHSQDDRFSKFMFGDRKGAMPHNHNHREVPNNKTSTFDVESIIENIVKLKDSSQNLKPLIQMVYPFVEQFLKKK
ncbi:hypothetical protein V7087_22530 [Neobacillus niacini]|uniref:hypothetical protein n=1 Tax=Neobacillus niacini TaxID=86668 RepID=UPI002FFEA891